jgi:hypothetical protein
LSEAKAAAPHPNLASLDPGCDDTISASYHSAQFCCNAGAELSPTTVVEAWLGKRLEQASGAIPKVARCPSSG